MTAGVFAGAAEFGILYAAAALGGLSAALLAVDTVLGFLIRHVRPVRRMARRILRHMPLWEGMR
jgi:hypothetical protein